MFLKKLFFASAAILCLVLAFHFGATNAIGQVGSLFQVIPGSPGWVRVGETVYCTTFNPPRWGVLPDGFLPPVPVSTLVYLDGTHAVTSAGEGWTKEITNSWHSVGIVPGGAATAARALTHGQLRRL